MCICVGDGDAGDYRTRESRTRETPLWLEFCRSVGGWGRHNRVLYDGGNDGRKGTHAAQNLNPSVGIFVDGSNSKVSPPIGGSRCASSA